MTMIALGLSDTLATGEPQRARVRLVPRGHEMVSVDVVTTVVRDVVTEASEVTWVLLATERGAAVAGPVRTSAVDALVDLTRLPLHQISRQDALRKVAQIVADALGDGVGVSVAVGHPSTRRHCGRRRSSPSSGTVPRWSPGKDRARRRGRTG